MKRHPALPCLAPYPFWPAAVPLERWDVDGFAKVSPNALEARFGSFVSGAQLFDAAAFSISRPEALYMDPQQRLLLQHAAEALWSRGSASLAGSKAGGVPERTGVMIGIGPAEYVNQTSELLPMGMYFATGGAISVAAGRWVWRGVERACTLRLLTLNVLPRWQGGIGLPVGGTDGMVHALWS
jgi:hypothetical protein